MVSDPHTKRGMTAEDLYRLRFAHRVALSPDGTRAAFTTMSPDAATNHNRYNLYVVSSNGGDTRVLVGNEPRDPSPSWSPDGKQLAIVIERGRRAQLFTLDVASSQLTQLTTGDQVVSTPLWSPTDDTIAFLGRVPSLPPPWHPVVFDDPSDTPKVITRAQYKFDGLGWFDTSRSQVFVVSSGGGEPRQLTHEPTGVFHPTWTSERGVPLGSMAWSHDGRRLAFVMSTNEDEERDGRCDVWAVEVASGTLTRVSPHDGLYGCPAWSPDDQQCRSWAPASLERRRERQPLAGSGERVGRSPAIRHGGHVYRRRSNV